MCGIQLVVAQGDGAFGSAYGGGVEGQEPVVANANAATFDAIYSNNKFKANERNSESVRNDVHQENKRKLTPSAFRLEVMQLDTPSSSS